MGKDKRFHKLTCQPFVFLQDRIINLAVGLFSSVVVLVSTNLLVPLLLLVRLVLFQSASQKLLALFFKVHTEKKGHKENGGAVTAALICSYFLLGMHW